MFLRKSSHGAKYVTYAASTGNSGRFRRTAPGTQMGESGGRQAGSSESIACLLSPPRGARQSPSPPSSRRLSAVDITGDAASCRARYQG